MHTTLTPEQTLLRQTIADLARSHGVANPTDLATNDGRAAWRALAGAGVLGLRQRDAAGDPVASGVDVALVVEELAAALVPVPYVGTAVMAAELLALAGSDWTDGVAAGDDRYGVSLTDDLVDLATVDALDRSVAWDVDGAQFALALDADGHSLVRVSLATASDAASTDLTRRAARLAGAAPIEGAVETSGVALGTDDLERWRALALTAVCADSVGVMRRALDLAVAYARTREAFGVPIGSFQAVQHMLADAFAQVETATNLTRYAAWSVDELPDPERLLRARVAKAYSARAVRQVTETAAQVFGGVGHTWEHVMHLYLRRAAADRELMGGESHHLRAIADGRLGAA